MQFKKMFLSCAIVAVASLLAATTVMASDLLSCTPADSDGIGDNLWVFEVTAGPCPIQCSTAAPAGTGNTFCDYPGLCTGIEYKISGSSDHVATLIGREINVQYPDNAVNVFDPCEGDNVTGLGYLACHEKAVRLNPDADTRLAQLVVEGTKAPGVTSIVGKKGRKEGACRILGIAVEGAEAPVSETVCHEGCCVEFMLDAFSGAILNAALTDDSPGSCSFEIVSVEDLEIYYTDPVTNETESLGTVKFGKGYAQSGDDSCVNHFVGGRSIKVCN